MICSICKTGIKEPVYVQITATVVRHDSNYIGSINFTPQERSDLQNNIIVHKKCWQNLLNIKNGKKIEIKD